MVTTFLLAASLVVGQADDAQEDPGYNTHLEPLAWLIGEWTSDQYSATGELKQTVKNTFRWAADGEVILHETSGVGPDGEAEFAELYVFFWDGSEKRINRRGFGKGYVTESKLVEEDETGLMWEQHWVFGSGNAGFYKAKIGRKPGDLDFYTKGWSKVSGQGMKEIGPFEFKRVK